MLICVACLLGEAGRKIKASKRREFSSMLSENIKTLRKQKGYSQETLAQELNVVRQTVSKWEKGYSVPDALMTEKLAELFEVSVGELLGEVEKEKLSDPKPDLAQISAQLAILNDQYARELARQEKIRKIKRMIFLPVLAVFLLSIAGVLLPLSVSCPMDSVYTDYGDITAVESPMVGSELYTQEEIHSAIECTKEYFFHNFEGCTLNRLSYAGDEVTKNEIQSLEEEALSSDEKFIILYADFYVESNDGGFSDNTAYENMKFYVWGNADGSWQVDGYGYA